MCSMIMLSGRPDGAARAGAPAGGRRDYDIYTMYMCVYIYIYICIHTCTSLSIYTCVYIYIYIHISHDR